MITSLWPVCRVGLSVLAMSSAFIGVPSQLSYAASSTASQSVATGIPEWMSGSVAMLGGASIAFGCGKRRVRGPARRRSGI